MGPELEYVLQAEQKGTGHAVGMAEALLGDWDGPLLVLPGDAPLLSASLLEALIAHHTHSGAAATLLTAVLDEAGSYGRIVRDAETGRVRGHRGGAGRHARPASNPRDRHVGLRLPAVRPVRRPAARSRPRTPRANYYLTDAIALLAGQGQIVEALVSPDADVVRGVNNRAELVDLREVLQARIHAELSLAGVTILDPLTTHIDATVKIGPDTTIHPFTILSGVTDIGEDCEIGPGARISDSRIGRGVSVRDSHVTASEVGDGCQDRPLRQPPPRQRLRPERQGRRLRGTQKRHAWATASPPGI